MKTIAANIKNVPIIAACVIATPLIIVADKTNNAIMNHWSNINNGTKKK